MRVHDTPRNHAQNRREFPGVTRKGVRCYLISVHRSTSRSSAKTCRRAGHLLRLGAGAVAHVPGGRAHHRAFPSGPAAVGPGFCGALQRHADASDRRTTAQERAQLYTRALGVPGGAAGDAEPNREFLSLWLRFLTAVSMFARSGRGRVNVEAAALPMRRCAARSGRWLSMSRLASRACRRRWR